MPLRPPALDDRSFNDLVDELVSRIPAHTPEWTSPTQGDPGRTLIELFAWLGDALLYRVNLVPERQRLAFLHLLGQQMRPAVPAAGMITVALNENALGSVTLASFAKVSGPPDFETLAELNVLPITTQAYYKRKLTAKEQQDHQKLLHGLQQMFKITKPVTGYQTTPLFANGMAEGTPFNVRQNTVDGSIWFAILASKPENVAAIQHALAGGPQNEQQILNVGFIPALEIPPLFTEIGPRGRINHEWTISLTTPANQPPNYLGIDVLSDSTGGLRRPGVQRLLLPQSKDLGAPSNDVRVDAQAGVGGLRPPRIDDATIASRIVTWLRLKPIDDLTLSWMGMNAVQIDQRQSFGGQIIGVSTGLTDQQFPVGAGSIDPSTFQLQVDETGSGFREWTQTDDLAVAARNQSAYSLDSEDGIVTFGDGIRGRIPPLGARIRVARMRAGGGRAGNLPPGSLKSITAVSLTGAAVTGLTAFQPVATTGGDDPETLESAERRIPGMLRHRDRVVTHDDYKTIAEQTPGVFVGRVEVLPLFKPQTKVRDAAGVVSVMALPRKDDIAPPNPRPDRAFLETIYAYLGVRKPLATELYVIGCEYVGLGISVGVEILPEFGADTVLQNIRTALREALWPLAPGGHAKTGWPLGRDVTNTEMEVVVGNVPGVAALYPINLFRSTGQGNYQAISASNGRATLSLQPWQLPELLKVVAVIGNAPTTMAPDVSADGGDVAVPVVPETC
jgi:baseplate J-like protein